MNAANLRTLLLLCILWLLPTTLRAEVAVVVNIDNPVSAMTPNQVSDYFLGRSRTFKNGSDALIFEQPRESPIRADFFRLLNGMSIKQLNAYWARLQFSGEIQPPPTLNDSRAVLAAVRKNRNAIGYVDAAVLDNSVRVVLRLSD